MDKKILVAGGTGFIGRLLVEKLLQKNYSVSVLTRDAESTADIFSADVKAIAWNDTELIKEVISETDSVINLAGANVMGKRWSTKYKQLILSSRVDSTRMLLDLIRESGKRAESFISASAIGYYPRSETEIYDEYSEPGDSYLAEVTKAWEEESKKAEELGIREVRVRTGIVLHKSGGALQRMLLPFKLFAGGPIGSGRQWFAWVHAGDVVNLFIKAIEDKGFNGAVNAVCPNPVNMNEFAKTLGKVMKRPAIFRVPAFVLKIVLGEASVEVLTGSRISPKRTMELGYNFEFENLEEALGDLLK